MHDFEASDGGGTTNIDTTIAATRIGSLRLTSDTDVGSNQISRMASSRNRCVQIMAGFKGQYVCPIHHRPCTRVSRPDSRALFVLASRTNSARVSQNGNCVTPSAHNHAEISRPASGVARSTDCRYSGVLGAPLALQILDSNLPSDSIHF